MLMREWACCLVKIGKTSGTCGSFVSLPGSASPHPPKTKMADTRILCVARQNQKTRNLMAWRWALKNPRKSECMLWRVVKKVAFPLHVRSGVVLALEYKNSALSFELFSFPTFTL